MIVTKKLARSPFVSLEPETVQAHNEILAWLLHFGYCNVLLRKPLH